MEVSGQLHASDASLPGKERRYSLDRSLVRPQSRYGLGGEEKNSQLYLECNPDRPARSLVTTATELSGFEAILQNKFKQFLANRRKFARDRSAILFHINANECVYFTAKSVYSVLLSPLIRWIQVCMKSIILLSL
jgi:hypothetical protein